MSNRINFGEIFETYFNRDKCRPLPYYCELAPGTKIGSLTILNKFKEGYMLDGKHIVSTILCECDCGNIKYINYYQMANNRQKFCSKQCVSKQKPKKEIIKLIYVRKERSFIRKELSYSSKSKEYQAWKNMIYRCHNPKNISYIHYGGRGITVHPEWRDTPIAFMEYIGKAPSPEHSIDRINVDGNYEPGNVRWATRAEQAKNKRSMVSKEKEITFFKQLLRDNNIEY